MSPSRVLPAREEPESPWAVSGAFAHRSLPSQGPFAPHPAAQPRSVRRDKEPPGSCFAPTRAVFQGKVALDCTKPSSGVSNSPFVSSLWVLSILSSIQHPPCPSLASQLLWMHRFVSHFLPPSVIPWLTCAARTDFSLRCSLFPIPS